MQFPCFLYHALHGPRLFNSAGELDNQSGWVDTPAKLSAPEEQPEEQSEPEAPKKRGRPRKVAE